MIQGHTLNAKQVGKNCNLSIEARVDDNYIPLNSCNPFITFFKSSKNVFLLLKQVLKSNI
jgi:hypothetical protein